MTTNVTVVTSATSQVLVPFTSAGNAAVVQAVLDAGANFAAAGGFMKYFSPANQAQASSLPNPLFLGGVVDTVPAALNFGILNSKYTSFVNAGTGLAVAIGGINTTLVSGQNASTIYINQSSAGEAYIGGGNNVLGNAFSLSSLTAFVDGAPVTSTVPGAQPGLGSSTLILDDTAGGTMKVQVGAGMLVALQGGGADSILAQSGTVVVLANKLAGAGSGVATIAAAGAGTDLWVGAQGGSVFVNPGAGNVFLFQAGAPGQENSATLFGGTKTIGGSSHSADTFSGRATVLGMNGYIEAGQAGGSILQSGFTPGAATMVAGGAGDIIFLQAAGNTARTGNALNVVVTAGQVTSGGGDRFIIGAGSGSVLGGQAGQNTFVFNGQGDYTIAGFHNTTVPATVAGFLQGSNYFYQPVAFDGAGTITIADFLPQQSAGGLIFDTFDLGAASIVGGVISSTLVGGGFNNVVNLSDGTTINFLHTNVAVTQSGTTII